jgi:predicted dehydrogenase
MEGLKAPLRGGMIGAGYFAGIQAEAWGRVPGARIVAVADPAPGKAKAFAERWGIERWFSSADGLLDASGVDFVDIATRPEAHRGLAELAFRRGLPVICQKPLAPSWEDCVAMVEASEEARARLLVHENWRWQPWYREARRLLDAGAIGRPFQLALQWRTGDGVGPEPYALQPYFREMPLLLVYETLVHHLDTMRYLGGEIRALFCRLRRVNPVLRGEDQALITVSLESGALGLIDANRLSGPERMTPVAGALLVEGDRGSVRVDPQGRLWVAGPERTAAPHDYPIPAAGYRGDSVKATQEHLAECLRAGKPCESEGREYLKTVKAVFACYRSHDTGREIGLEGFTP